MGYLLHDAPGAFGRRHWTRFLLAQLRKRLLSPVLISEHGLKSLDLTPSVSMKGAVNAMVMKNRSRMDIYFDILSAARQSVRKTHIMYKSNLSYKQLDVYLGALIECNLIEEGVEDGARVYNVTSRGLNFIELFENISAYLSPKKTNQPPDLVSKQPDLEVINRQSFAY